jgi:membrane-associated protease RseP (regulator of RpoE activity)
VKHHMQVFAMVAALAVGAGSLTAQETPRPPRPSRAPRASAAPRAFTFTTSDNRGRLGVLVNSAANADSDKIGARLEGVTPGGPAEKAGLQAGDVITKFNGTPLGGLVAADEDESGPGMKLVQLAHKLEPGDTVKIEYRRGSDTKTATIIAQDVEPNWTLAGPGAMTMPRIEVNPEIHMGPMTGMLAPGAMKMDGFSFCYGDSWCDLDLVSLNPDLGSYFGTSDGVLVVKSSADSALPLKGGDVILTIGGRKPTSPSHAMRILRSYDVGETVSIDVMRKQKRITVSWKVPENNDERSFMRSRERTPRPERQEQSRYKVMRPQMLKQMLKRSVRFA